MQEGKPVTVDVIGFHPKREGTERVWVVSCKSWQAGFDPREKIAAIEGDKIRSGRLAWRAFRELHKPKWADGLIAEIERLTGSTQFTYCDGGDKVAGRCISMGAASTFQEESSWESNQDSHASRNVARPE